VSYFAVVASSQDLRVFEEVAAVPLDVEAHCESSGQELCAAEATHRQQTCLNLRAHNCLDVPFIALFEERSESCDF